MKYNKTMKIELIYNLINKAQSIFLYVLVSGINSLNISHEYINNLYKYNISFIIIISFYKILIERYE